VLSAGIALSGSARLGVGRGQLLFLLGGSVDRSRTTHRSEQQHAKKGTTHGVGLSNIQAKVSVEYS
jgi:hypothetical protein